MIEADKSFKKLDYSSIFIHGTSWISRLHFAVKTDKSMEAKFGNGTIDVFLALYLRVMYRKAITLYCTYLLSLVYAWKYLRDFEDTSITSFVSKHYHAVLSTSLWRIWWSNILSSSDLVSFRCQMSPIIRVSLFNLHQLLPWYNATQ